MAEQSHKREMSEALRRDFERLRARRAAGGAARTSAAQPSRAQTERIVLTRPPRPEEPPVEAASPDSDVPKASAGLPPGAERRGWLRSLLGRR